VATGEAVPGVALRIIRRTERLPTVECAFGLGWQEFWELTRRSAAFAEPVTSDAEGIARFPHLLPGDYNVSLESDEWSPTAGYQHTVGETWSPDIFVVEVRHLAVLEVTALDRGSGRVLTGLTVRLEPQPEPGDRSMSSHFRRLRDEVERFEHLEDGTYIVTLESEQGRALSSQPVTLAPGETRRLDFRIDA
jgi:hypothetical protein